jgi:UDP-N-acetylmuramyl pentapeptide phosphotransferase/UDP-N-acetylglucosamine-1-phosphate transferase
VIKIASKKGLLDQPDKRKQHNQAKVRLGGIAIILGFILTIIVSSLIPSLNINFFEGSEYFIKILLGGGLLFFLGLADDLFNFSPIFRLFIQTFIGLISWLLGIRIEALNINIFGTIGLSLDLTNTLSILITTFWIVAIVNAFNWLDGLDGQASGLNIIYLLTLIFFCYLDKNIYLIYFCVINIGCSIGFLRYNKYPSKILMGDGGAYFMGYSLATISVIATNTQYFNLMTCLVIFFIPILDMVNVIFSRIRSGKSPFYPDRNHLHYRLIDNYKISHKNTVTLNYVINSIFCTLAIIFS